MRTNGFARTGKAVAGIGVALVAAVLAGSATLPVARAAEDAFAVARPGGLGAQSTGTVHVNGRLVMRLRDTPRDGSGAGQADEVARRLNELNGSGALTAASLRVERHGSQAQIVSGNRLIVEVTPQQARAAGMPAWDLAQSWRNNLVLALRQGGPAVVERGGTAVRETPVAYQRPAEETRTKIVPILTVGSSFRAGVAQVTGPVSRVDEVKAVARLNTDYKDAVRIAVLVPVASENVVSNIRRVPQVSISAVGDLKL